MKIGMNFELKLEQRTSQKETVVVVISGHGLCE